MFMSPALERSTGHLRLPVRLSEPSLRSVTPMTEMTQASMTRPGGMGRRRNDRRMRATLAAGAASESS